MADESTVIDLFPVETEILDDGGENSRTCDICNKQFANTSACRLHRVKSHRMVDDITDKRLFDRTSEKARLIYHCPNEKCLERAVKFEGMRNLRQHYVRVHTEKKHTCECGYRTALQKDFIYHQRVRCQLLKLQATDDPDGKPSRPHLKRKKKINGEDETPKLAATFALPPMESLQNGKKMVVQPIFLIVPAPDVASVVESIAESLGNKNEVAIRTCAAGTMVTRISSTDSPRLDNNSPNLNNLRSLLDGVEQNDLHRSEPYSYNHPSTSTICENGQVMQNQNDQQSNYYYPENAREERGTAMDQILDDCNMYCTYDQYDMNSVGDMKPNIRPTTADFGNNYVSEGPQTRNFGTTMFDCVSTRHAGTSMTDELDSFLLRDIETQTPDVNFPAMERDEYWRWRDN